MKSMSSKLAVMLVLAMLLASAAFSATPVRAADGDLTVVIHSVLYINGMHPESSQNGKAVAWDTSFTISKSGSKKINHNGTYSYVGGANTKASGLGYDYQFLNEFVLTTADGGIMTEEAADGLKRIERIANSGDGVVVVTYVDGTKETFTDMTTIYISPVYKQTARWYLNYHYVDNISTGSGSWSNKDFVVSFSHTYKNPLDASPRSHYQFLYWEVEETTDRYEAGETMTYTGAELSQGETKDMYVYAWYQPSVTVRYYYEGNKSGEDVEKFENINIYDFEADHGGLDFAGWYDAEGNRLDEAAVAELPAITKDAVDQKIITVYAHYNASITPEDNTKVYGDEDPELTATTDGFAEGEEPEYELTREEGEDVGKYEISVAEGASAPTYTGGITKYNITAETATFTITPAELTVTAEDNTKVYGDEDPELTAKVEGLKNGDSEDVVKYELKRGEGENVGEYEIAASGEEEQGNYTVTYVNGTFTITPAELTVTAEDNTKVYGDTDPELEAKVEGLKNGDTEDVVKYELKRAEGENVGEYEIAVTGEEAQGNYTVTFVDGTFTITPAELTVTAGDNSKAFGETDPELAAKVEGLKNGDTEDVVKYELKRAEGEDVGEYAITPSGEKAQGNYTVTFVDGTFTITPSDTPDTGDRNNMELWAAAMLISAAGAMALAEMKRRRARA